MHRGSYRPYTIVGYGGQMTLRRFISRFIHKESAVIPEEETVEETTEETMEEVVEEVIPDPPTEEIPATPVADSKPVPTLDEQIAAGAVAVQDAVSAFRDSKTAEHDAGVALTVAQAESQRILAEAQAGVDAADGAEADALMEANAAIDAQVANLTSLKAAINA